MVSNHHPKLTLLLAVRRLRLLVRSTRTVTTEQTRTYYEYELPAPHALTSVLNDGMKRVSHNNLYTQRGCAQCACVVQSVPGGLPIPRETTN